MVRLAPQYIGSIEGKAILPPSLEDEIILTVNSWFPNVFYSIEVGMTKTTIIPEIGNYVYKIPHNGVYIPTIETKEISPIMYFKPLEKDACKYEQRFYVKIPDKIRKFFLPLDVWDKKPQKKGPFITIYCQSKVNVMTEQFDRDEPNPDNEIKEYFKRHFPSYENISRYWFNRAIEKYGEEAVIDLFVFLQVNKIEDLDYSNLGITKNGDPVIIDYGGICYYKDIIIAKI